MSKILAKLIYTTGALGLTDFAKTKLAKCSAFPVTRVEARVTGAVAPAIGPESTNMGIPKRDSSIINSKALCLK
jgi:hypothetical protein